MLDYEINGLMHLYGRIFDDLLSSCKKDRMSVRLTAIEADLAAGKISRQEAAVRKDRIDHELYLLSTICHLLNTGKYMTW